MRFIHYTKNLDSLIGILTHGLIIHPCERRVFHYFTDRVEFADSEPQRFGMVCLHGFRVLPNVCYWRKYGPYGIEMEPSWVREQPFKQVLYLKPSGLRFSALKREFDKALEDLDWLVNERASDDAFPRMAYKNKNVALVLGANKWVNFLDRFEYLQPHGDKFEKEWRFVRRDPFESDDSIPQIISNLNREGVWTHYLYPLKFERKDVHALHIPKRYIGDLRDRLSPRYDGTVIRWGFNSALRAISALTCHRIKISTVSK